MIQQKLRNSVSVKIRKVNIESPYDQGTILSDNKDTYQSELDGSSKNACL